MDGGVLRAAVVPRAVEAALTSALLVDSVSIPILIMFALFHVEPLRWGYLIGVGGLLDGAGGVRRT